MPRKREINLGMLLVSVLSLCAVLYGAYLLLREDPDDRAYLTILGRSFIFNYRVSDVYAGFTAVPQRPIPVGSRLVVIFENPSGGAPFVVEHQIGGADRRLSVRSPPMRGVRADVPYNVTVRLLTRQDRAEFARQSFTITSNISDDVVPTAPLTVGPGYHRNPAAPPDG